VTFGELEERIIPLPEKWVIESVPWHRDDTIIEELMSEPRNKIIKKDKEIWGIE
jgi:hypothetical protein